MVRAIHADGLAEFGGREGDLNAGHLDSALTAPQMLAAYEEPTVWELAACYAYHLSKAHAFNDGNKRMAGMSTFTFLSVNGFELQADCQRTIFRVIQCVSCVTSRAIKEHQLKSFIARKLEALHAVPERLILS